MRKLSILLFLVLLLPWLARGQQVPTQISTQQLTLLPQAPLAQVTTVQEQPSIKGTATYYYWFVSNNGSGTVSPPAGPFPVYKAPATLGGIYTVQVSWNPAPGVATYDVLRTTTTAIPTGACACAVITGTALASFTDNLASTTAYTVATSSSQVPAIWTNMSATGGVLAVKNAANDGVIYVSSNGNDLNDGLSWGSAKLTMAAACAALPGGNSSCSTGAGLIRIAPGFTGAMLSPTTANITITTSLRQIVYVDGVQYPFTAAGVQSAISAIHASGGVGGIVILPNTSTIPSSQSISLGTTTLTIPSSVVVQGSGNSGTWLNYQGSGAAVDFPAGTAGAGLVGVTIQLGGSTSGTSVAIELDGTSGGDTSFNIINGINFFCNSDVTGQKGLYINSTAPAFVSANYFDNLLFTQTCDKPIVSTDDEANSWNNIEVTNFPSGKTAISLASNDDIFQGRIAGIGGTGSIGFAESGIKNQITLTCDFGTGGCIDDTGGNNHWNLNLLTAIGTLPVTSAALYSDAATGGQHAFFSSLAITDEGSCTMTSGTCSAQSLGHTYAAAPKCYANWTGSGTLTGLLKVPDTTTTVTPASSVSTDSAVVNWICFGN